MTVEVRLRPEAEQDLSEAARWYEEQRRGLRTRIPLLGFGDFFGHRRKTTRQHCGLRVITSRPFAPISSLGLFYLVDGDGAVVIGVLHGSRHPRRWKNRL